MCGAISLLPLCLPRVHRDNSTVLYHCLRSAHVVPDDRSLRIPCSKWQRRKKTADEILLRNILWPDQTKHVLHVVIYRAATTVTFEQRIVLMLFANTGNKSASASTFGLISLRTLSWSSVCYLTVELLKDIAIFWKLFYWGCWNVCL